MDPAMKASMKNNSALAIEFEENASTDINHKNDSSLKINLESLCDDNIIQKYMQLLQKRNAGYKTGPQISWLFFSSIELTGAEGFCSLCKDLPKFLKYDIIFFPVHLPEIGEGGHWALIAVFPSERLIKSYDSLGYEHRDRLRQVLIFLEYSSNKINCTFDKNEWKLFGNSASLPRQQNKNDCGFWVCLYAETLARNINPTKLISLDSRSVRMPIAAALRRGKLDPFEGLEFTPEDDMIDNLDKLMRRTYPYDVILDKKPKTKELETSTGDSNFIAKMSETMSDVSPIFATDEAITVDNHELCAVEQENRSHQTCEAHDRETRSTLRPLQNIPEYTARQERSAASSKSKFTQLRMKRRTKFVRLPDGSKKRVNVRKLGLPVYKPWG